MVWLPRWLAFRINPVTFLVDNFPISVGKQVREGSTVLDAGAGECRYASLFSHCKYISLDFAKGDNTWDYKRVSIIGDLLSLPIKSNVFDAVICTQTMEHVSNPFTLLQEISRVLISGGSLYLTVPQHFPVHQAPHDFFRFTRYALEHLFRTSGFIVESIQPKGGYWFYLSNSLLHMHRALFPRGRPLSRRNLLFPLQFLVLLFAGFLGPLVLNYVDRFNKNPNFSLNYECICRKA